MNTIIFEAYNQNIKVQFIDEQEAIAYATANQMEVRSFAVSMPVSEVRANWQGFLDALDLPERGGNGLFGLGIMLDRNLFLDIYQLILRLEDIKAAADSSVKEWLTFNFLYGMAIVLYSPEQRLLVEQCLIANNIPIPSN